MPSSVTYFPLLSVIPYVALIFSPVSACFTTGLIIPQISVQHNAKFSDLLSPSVRESLCDLDLESLYQHVLLQN